MRSHPRLASPRQSAAPSRSAHLLDSSCDPPVFQPPLASCASEPLEAVPLVVNDTGIGCCAWQAPSNQCTVPSVPALRLPTRQQRHDPPHIGRRRWSILLAPWPQTVVQLEENCARPPLPRRPSHGSTGLASHGSSSLLFETGGVNRGGEMKRDWVRLCVEQPDAGLSRPWLGRPSRARPARSRGTTPSTPAVG